MILCTLLSHLTPSCNGLIIQMITLHSTERINIRYILLEIVHGIQQLYIKLFSCGALRFDIKLY